MTRTLPPGRYTAAAKPARPKRWLVWALSAAVVVVGVIVAFVAYDKFAVSEIDSEATSFDLVSDSQLDITFTVTRQDPSRDAVCIVRSRSKDGSETGRREVFIAGGEDQTVKVTAPVYTSRPPAMGDIYGCSLDVPAYLTGG
ncbi:DUF4307 domain-containing protein [Rhodococcus jostii]|uniref:DUF4307 domain-containing protein n=1 Tax=Rhodococcus jostii TaxID=132919 RepID=A0A1H5IIX0_RHOJO|nr:DUF4307 domain-containing protein [Rhodococcus jostii]MDT2008275.1 DUF4307 domain-containing protein [Rhodococcus opacus]RZK94220.1 MAG: DUF4307 domain-containing protein [Rhodococcus sp. (in: high G+C Gram-positive bacteria)]SEE39831.1 protein of unknown function [Rhodococcus jostii]